MNTIFVVKSIYDYNESKDPSILTFEAGERFVLIKEPDRPEAEWYYVINHKGQIGYIPHSYVLFEEDLPNEELTKLVDQIANNLDLNEKNQILTDRQRKHAQIKLAQLRCEITQMQDKTTKPSELTAIEENNLEDEEDDDQDAKVCRRCRHKSSLEEESLNENLISNLIENIKLDASMSEEKAIVVTGSVIRTLADNVLAWSNDCRKMLEILDKYEQEKVNSENVYSSKLKCIFKRLWFCKDDSQQRNWPVYEDEDMIASYLDELSHLLLDTDKHYLENEICSNGFENILNLISYFQMEIRRSLRMKLMDIFIHLIRFYGNRVAPEFFLPTVLPLELTAEMQNHLADAERWIRASNLFTLIFSSGHPPPFSIYEHLNEKFFSKQFDLLEGFDINGTVIECGNIQAEYIISPILAFNLHSTDVAESVIFKALRKRTNASHFTENLISYLNWEEDIILTSCAYVRPNTDNSTASVPNSVLKFLIEMFSEKVVSSLFYYNDVRVIIDIIINQLNNLPVGDHRISKYLSLTLNIMNNTQYVEEPHKAAELKKCLASIQHHEFSNAEDMTMARFIIDNFNETFNYANQL